MEKNLRILTDEQLMKEYNSLYQFFGLYSGRTYPRKEVIEECEKEMSRMELELKRRGI